MSKPTLWVTLITLTVEMTFVAAEHFHPAPSFSSVPTVTVASACDRF